MAALAQTMQADRLRFPALLPDEVLVLRAWLKLHESEYDTFDYNMRIGQGIDPGATFDQSVRDANIKNTQLRIDAVAFKGSQPTIIEVKRRCTPSNVGQILTYHSVWRQQFPSGPDPIMRLVCNTFSPHIVARVRESGIQLDVVQVDFSGLKSRGTP